MKQIITCILVLANIAAVFLIFIIQPNVTELRKKRLKDMRPWLLAQTPYETTTSASPTPEYEHYQNIPSSTHDEITSTEYNAPLMQEITPSIAPPAPAPTAQSAPKSEIIPSPTPSPVITIIQKLIQKIESVFELRVPGIRRAPATQSIQSKKFNNDILRLVKFFSRPYP